VNEDQYNLTEEQVVVESQEIALPITDSELNQLLDRKIEESKAKRTLLKLDKRTKENWKYFKGDQIDVDNLDRWQLPFVDNAIYDDTNYRIVMAASRIPDINIISPNEDIQSQDNADDIKQVVESNIKTRAVKSMVKKGLLYLHTDLLGVMKVRWDKNRGKTGDYVFEIVKPGNIEVDMTSTIPDDGFTADNMEVVIEWLDEPTKVVMAKFPSKKDDLTRELGKGNKRDIPAKIRYMEAHFTFYTDAGEQMEGVCWRYQNLILGKEKSPNWDWNGYMGASDQPATDESGQPVAHPLTGEPIYMQEQKYRNFFDQPRKPYIFFSYLNDNEAPMEISSPIEQSIALQRNLNRRGRQITEIADNVVPKLAFNGQYIDKEAVRNITKDPNEHIWIPNDGEVNDAPITDMVTEFSGAPPSPELLADMEIMRSRIAQKFSTGNANQRTGAQRESGISKQITKEVDLAVSDDITEIVVERVIYEMVSWSLQMMKLNYDEEHYTRTLGRDGNAAYISMTQDKIEDGIVVEVEVSATKKAERQATAQFLAANKAIDPLSLLEDMDVPNEKARVQRLLSFTMGASDNYRTYLTQIDIDPNTMPAPPMQPPAGGKPGENPTGSAPPQAGNPGDNGAPQMDATQAQKDLEALVQGQQVQPTGEPTEEYIQVFADFVQSGHLESLPPEAQQAIQDYIGLLQPQGAVA